MLHRLFIAMAGLFLLLGIAAPAAAQCTSPQVQCGGQCVILTTDDRNCGACGVRCEDNEHCRQGKCIQSCPDAQLLCGGLCSTPASDPNNCGGCGNVCPYDAHCVHGQCKPFADYCADTCPTGQLMCSGRCRDIAVDYGNCGACGVGCHPGQTCSKGKCLSSSEALPIQQQAPRTDIKPK